MIPAPDPSPPAVAPAGAGGPAPGPPPALDDRAKLAILLSISRAMTAEADLDGLLALILREATRALAADRGTLFLLDRARDELWARIALGLEGEEIRLKTTRGVAGFVATTGARANVPDASADPRFDPEMDRRTGYRTRTVAAVPVRTAAGDLVGVLEVLNKREGVFSRDDEEFLEALASQAGVAIQNARLVDELRRANAALKQLDEMKSNFLATVSHELRSPLAPIVGYLQLFLSEAPGPLTAKQRRGLDVMMQSARRLQGLIEDLLTFLNLERGAVGLNRQRLALGPLLAEQAQALTAAARDKGIELQADIAAGLPAVVADPRALGRAVSLMLDNALKFTPAGGRVTLSVALAAGAWPGPSSAPARAGSRPGPRDAVRVAVTDTGIGIPENQVPRIFDRFYQVDSSTTRQFGGTGLGLTLVKRIVEAHGSQVAVESRLGAGSTFAFLLPTA